LSRRDRSVFWNQGQVVGHRASKIKTQEILLFQSANMKTSNSGDEPPSPKLCSWISGTITVYPRFGAPRKASFPSTWENQRLFRRLEEDEMRSKMRAGVSGTKPSEKA
jgi:hypothetical protein